MASETEPWFDVQTEKNSSAGRSGCIWRRADLASPAVDLGAVKTLLGTAPHARLDSSRDDQASVQSIARHFFVEVFGTLKRRYKQPRDVVFTVPADAFAPYREHLTNIAKENGFKGVSFIDEPVATALGYGLDLGSHRVVVVVDAGRHATHLAAVRLTPRQARLGTCEVLVKASAELGGDLVDRALASALRATQPRPESSSDRWYAELLDDVFLDEVRRAKERAAYGERALLSRSILDGAEPGDATVVALDHRRIEKVVGQMGLYNRLEVALSKIIVGLESVGLTMGDIDDVLLVGGCSLLPGFKDIVQSHFPGQKVHHWQPFDASVIGAARFGGQGVNAYDFVSHTYALAVHSGQSSEPQFVTVIESGTHFPTPRRHWQMQLSPACIHGQSESYFRLVVYEMAPEPSGDNSQAKGSFRGENKAPRHRVALNRDKPITGELVPPHTPDDLGPRLDVSFWVDPKRQLRVSVQDLKTGRLLVDDERVVQTM